MWQIDEQTKAGVASRARVGHLVLQSVPDALAEARANPHPWYRCQSLTSVAEAIRDDAEAALILNEALAAAQQQEEPNRVVSVAAWPVNVFVRRAIGDMAPVIAELLQTIEREPNPVRRADGLLMLLEAVLSDRELVQLVLTPLLDACAKSRGWKGRRILQSAALMLTEVNGRLAREVMQLIPESREARRARQMLPRRQWAGARHFPFHVKSR